MKMYIGNCTRQSQDFLYRKLETGGGRPAPHRQKIEIGAQIMISGDLTSEEIDYIVEQHARYGLVKVDEVDRTKPYIGLVWDTKPIQPNKLRYAIEHNTEALVDRGREIRKENAVALHSSLNAATPGDPSAIEVRNLTFETVEEKGGSVEHDMISERITVQDGPQHDARPSMSPRKGKR